MHYTYPTSPVRTQARGSFTLHTLHEGLTSELSRTHVLSRTPNLIHELSHTSLHAGYLTIKPLYLYLYLLPIPIPNPRHRTLTTTRLASPFLSLTDISYRQGKIPQSPQPPPPPQQIDLTPKTAKTTEAPPKPRAASRPSSSAPTGRSSPTTTTPPPTASGASPTASRPTRSPR